VPPLRRRRADIVPLAQRFLSTAAVRNHRGPLHFSPEAAAAIKRYGWPGNVRELQNVVERAAVLTRGDVITSDYLPDTLFREAAEGSPSIPPVISLEEMEKEHIIQVLAETPTLEDAAARLGINISTLWRKRKRYGID
jgi:NtrC-family two-component system response regulator AlgB